MVKLIDCTIRDGGHLNNWNFTADCIKNSYFAALNAGADYFETGYRCNAQNTSLGKFAYCDDVLLKEIFKERDSRCKISVMIDAGKCDIDKFQDCKEYLTPISLVRVATYPDNITLALNLCEGLKKKGYDIFLNLMAVSRNTEKHFEILSDWKNKDILDAVCFADSFGTFMPDDVGIYFNKLRQLGFKNIGFHSHNNIQMAFANTVKAIELGVYSIDASIFGMGRDAGNVPSELICGYLNKRGDLKFNPIPYLEAVEKIYKKLNEETPWGYSTPSLIGGLKNIHPHYVYELYKKKNSNISEVWKDLDYIDKNTSLSFSTDCMDNLLSKL